MSNRWFKGRVLAEGRSLIVCLLCFLSVGGCFYQITASSLSLSASNRQNANLTMLFESNRVGIASLKRKETEGLKVDYREEGSFALRRKELINWFLFWLNSIPLYAIPWGLGIRWNFFKLFCDNRKLSWIFNHPNYLFFQYTNFNQILNISSQQTFFSQKFWPLWQRS